MTVVEYIKELNAQYKTGKATEHSYRPALKELLQSLLPKMTVINEPRRYDFGAPDYILMRKDAPVAFRTSLRPMTLRVARRTRSSSTDTSSHSTISSSLTTSTFGCIATESLLIVCVLQS